MADCSLDFIEIDRDLLKDVLAIRAVRDVTVLRGVPGRFGDAAGGQTGVLGNLPRLLEGQGGLLLGEGRGLHGGLDLRHVDLHEERLAARVGEDEVVLRLATLLVGALQLLAQLPHLGFVIGFQPLHHLVLRMLETRETIEDALGL